MPLCLGLVQFLQLAKRNRYKWFDKDNNDDNNNNNDNVEEYNGIDQYGDDKNDEEDNDNNDYDYDGNKDNNESRVITAAIMTMQMH